MRRCYDYGCINCGHDCDCTGECSTVASRRGDTRLTFKIPPESWLTSNRHGIHRGQRARIVRELHAVAQITARTSGLEPIAGPVLVDWTVRYPKGVRRDKGDASNAQPTTKALLDGLVPRWLEDDGPQHVVRESFQRGLNLDIPREHWISLVITSQDIPWLAATDTKDDRP